MSCKWGSTPGLTDWLTVSRNVTLTLTLTSLTIKKSGVGVGNSNIVGIILQFFKLRFICVYCATIVNIIEQFNKWLSLHITTSHTVLLKLDRNSQASERKHIALSNSVTISRCLLHVSQNLSGRSYEMFHPGLKTLLTSTVRNGSEHSRYGLLGWHEM
jgi:hypothetical protein